MGSLVGERECVRAGNVALVEKNTIERKGSSTQPADQSSLRFRFEDSTLTFNFSVTPRTNLSGLGGKHREVSPISSLEFLIKKISQLDVDPLTH